MLPPLSLDTLPNEVQMMLLYACPDIATLRSLVCASPSLHALYAASREHVFTTFALQTLHRRDVRIFQPMHWALIYLKGPDISFDRVKQAIELCIQQLIYRMPIKLTIEYCQALLSIQATKRWLYDEDHVVDARKIHDRDEEDTFLALDMRDPEVHRRIIPVKGWPKPRTTKARRR